MLEGHAEKVEREDGTVAHLLFNLAVYAKPGAIPNELTVDVTNMEITTPSASPTSPCPRACAPRWTRTRSSPPRQISRETIEVAEEEEFVEALDELAEAASRSRGWRRRDGGGDDSGGDASDED